MTDVTLTRGDGRILSFSRPRRGTDGEIWSVEVTLTAPGLAASRRVAAHYATAFDELVEFFGQLAENWRGWEGAIVYESLEGELHLSATHDGRVEIEAMLRKREPPAWSAAATVTLDPGEQMTSAAGALRDLLRSHP